ncbi:MAG: Elongation factor Ts [Berkelbacteria bacterium GW2011_GWA2_35_9]|uniref:Elongation factor Ts n=1 Tax=Berkelbacteria bacterium GW2011_GWA2_35_9 TaxID=1618333 RepID=A0A0G0D4Y9_9BACT|nr:MAG: Elongation factor Ts [Berkelbacteria bacterium GW2011_GWA2_35_9]
MTSIEQIKALRDQTSASIADIQSSLEEAKGDEKKALEILNKKGQIKASKKTNRETKAGLIETYSHMEKIGVLVEINCETDFVAKNEEFVKFAHNLALQIASMNPESVDDLLSQDYIFENGKTIKNYLEVIIAKTGENITIKRFVRMELGGKDVSKNS